MDLSLATPTPTNEPHPLARMLGVLQRALLHPARYFREDFPRQDKSFTLAFGLGNAWMASCLAFFFQTFNSLLLVGIFERWVQKLLAAEDSFRLIEFSGKNFVWDAGGLVLLPFAYLLRSLAAAFVLFLFARLLIEDDPDAPERVSYGATLKIEASAFLTHWYKVVPFFGPFLTMIASFIVLITGVRERFGVSTRRAAVVVLAPWLLLAFGALLLTLLVVFAVSQLPFQELMNIDWTQFGKPRT